MRISDWSSDVCSSDLLQADFVIIGGGTAGCVLADRLSACGRHRVLLIEAGGADRSPWIHIPLGYGKLFDHPRLDWRFATVPQAGLDGRSIGVPRGAVLGGCSSTNEIGEAPCRERGFQKELI